MKTELLVQMDGVQQESENIFILAASNLPWDLDFALLRRMEKRVLAPLPNSEARRRMIEYHLGGSYELEDDSDLHRFSERMDGFSGADTKLFCKEAAMRPLRRFLQGLSHTDHRGPSKTNVRGSQGLRIMTGDLEASMKCTNSTSSRSLMKKYYDWAEDYGSM